MKISSPKIEKFESQKALFCFRHNTSEMENLKK